MRMGVIPAVFNCVSNSVCASTICSGKNGFRVFTAMSFTDEEIKTTCTFSAIIISLTFLRHGLHWGYVFDESMFHVMRSIGGQPDFVKGKNRQPC